MMYFGEAMDFHEYKTIRDTFKSDLPNLSSIEIDSLLMQAANWGHIEGRAGSREQVATELGWLTHKRPSYRVWPTIIPLLTRINLDFPANAVEWNVRLDKKLPAFCIRLPKDKNLLKPVKSILVGYGFIQKQRSLGLWVDLGETIKGTNIPVYDYIVMPLDDRKVDDIIKWIVNEYNLPIVGSDFSTGILHEVCKLVFSVLLVAAGKDSQIIRPDVLSKDERAYIEALEHHDTERIKIIENRAIRRKGPQWDIGASYEPSAYVVPPHPQRYWVGPGRTKVVIITRKGYVVNKDQITSVPND